MSKRGEAGAWGLLLALALLSPPGGALQPERCAAQTREIVVNPDAEAFIGAVLPVRGAGPGLLGCGPPSQDGVELVEALRWATGVLNSGAESLIPGVKIGLKIWDTCGHVAAVAPALSSLLPVLREGPALCTLAANESALLVGVVDGAGATRDLPTRQTLAQHGVPVLVLEPETLVPAEDRAKAAVALALELQWRQVAIVYGADDYGTRMYRAAVRLAADSDLCVVAAERLGSEDEVRPAGSTLAAVRGAAMTAAATPRGSNMTGVLVLSRRSHYLPLLTTLRHADSSGLQWLFSDLLTTEDFTPDKFFSLTLAPASIAPFEQFWASRVEQSGRGDENLVQQLEMSRRGCKLPGWAGPHISELPNCAETPARDSPDSLRAALRGRNAAAALHVVHTLGYALRAAWQETCGGQDEGVCPGLRLLARQQFTSKYLATLEFDHSGVGSRVSGVPRGGKVRAGDPSEMAASSLALLAYRGDSGNQKLHKLFEYHLDGVEVSDRSFRSSLNRVDVCSDDDDGGQCPRCLRLREARVRGATSARSTMTRLPAHHTIPSPQHVYVAGVFSVHAAPSPGTPLLGECGPLEAPAARQVEAFTWALRRVNDRVLAPLGIKLGAVLLDACHNSGRALTLPAALMGEGEPVLAAVNGLSGDEAAAANTVFTALNVTSLATASQGALEERYSMQVGPAAGAMAAAVQGVLQHLGWDYVSVVTSRGDEAAHQAVKTLAACVAHEEVLSPEEPTDRVLSRLIEAGARGVVLWGSPRDTRRVLAAAARAHAGGSLKAEQLFWLVVSPQGDATQLLEQFGDVLGGALVFSPEQKPVRDFLQYLRRLRHDEIHKMADNPWLEAYYDQVLTACSGPECERSQQQLLEEGSPQDARTVQAVFALGAAVARARREICPDLPAGIPGLCPPGGNRPDMRQALNSYLHYTPSERAGGGDDFTFTSRGAGDVAVEITNLRRGGARVKSRTSGVSFEKVGVYRGEMQSLAGLLGYRDSGEEVQLSSLTSRCSQRCSRCRAADRFLVTHPAVPGAPGSTLYLGVSLSMHEAAETPLECGSEVSNRGVQQLEALLWALDRVNTNGSVRLSAVVMDSCGSSARAARDVAILLDDQNQDRDKLIAMISSDGSSVASTTTNLAVPVGLPVITSDAPFYKPHAPFPLQLNAGPRARTEVLVTLAHRLGWTAVSVVYEDGGDSEAMMRAARAEARLQGITLAPVPLTRGGEREVVTDLRDSARQTGVRVAVVLLPRRALENVLRAAKELLSEGELVPGEIVWLGVQHEDLFQTFSEATLGSLVLQPRVGWVPDFEAHFRSLSLSRAAPRDPWFSEFWARVFGCRGAACSSGLYRDLAAYHVDKSPEVVNVINAVMSISHALESVRRELCPATLNIQKINDTVFIDDPGAGDCSAMQDATRVRRRLLEVAPRMAFVGAGMSSVAFSGGENAGAGLTVLNVRSVGSHVFGLVPVGSAAPELQLQTDAMKAYGPDLGETPLSDVTSECRECGGADGHHDHMEVSPGRAVTILAVGSVHSPGSLSRCGPLRSPASFQRAAALAFAVERANAAVNSSSLSALLLDDCSRPSRAIYQTFGFLAEQNGSVVSNPDTVAMALLLDSHNVGLAGLLDSQGIPHVTTEDESAVMRARLNAALGVARDLGWSRVTLVRRQESSWGRKASDMLVSEILPTLRTMCLGGELVVDLSSEDLSKDMLPVVNNPLLMVFETAAETKQVLDAISELRHRPRVVIASGWDSSVTYNNTMDADVFTVGEDLTTDVVPGFREFVTSTVTANSGSVPSEWSAEFLDGASSAKWQQASGVSDIVRIVEWVAEEVQRLCYQDEDAPLCGQDPQAFRDEIQATLTAKMSAKAPNLAVWRLNGTKSYDRVGRWRKEAGLNVDVRTWRRMDVVECESLRVGRSGKLTLALDEATPPSSLLGELRTLWGVVCAALSVLGALLTVALLVFFASSTHKVAGTSVLGFLILFGVLLLYGSTLAFLVSPSPVSCLVKRLLPGLAYAVVIAGMLLKVVTTWRCQACPKGSLSDGDPLSRPGGLLCCALSLVVVQAFLAGGWLLLVPADVAAPTSLGGGWTCAAASGRELIGSLSFLAALLLATAAVALKARKDGEARNILACCFMLALAAGAWVAAANSATLSSQQRDCVAGVVAGLVSATLVLLCLFVPKMLQFARLSREANRHQARAVKMQPVMYGVPHYPSSSSPHTLVIKAFPEPDELAGVERMVSGSDATSLAEDEDGSEPELAAIRDDVSDEVLSALYPLDMFAGHTTSTFGHGAPPPPPMPPMPPRLALVEHCSEFPPPPPPMESALGGLDLSSHEGISYI